MFTYKSTSNNLFYKFNMKFNIFLNKVLPLEIMDNILKVHIKYQNMNMPQQEYIKVIFCLE